MYFQFLFAVDRVKEMDQEHPEWKSKRPFKALLEGDMKTVAAGAEKALLEVVMTMHAGMTAEEFTVDVKNLINTVKHPKTGKGIG